MVGEIQHDDDERSRYISVSSASLTLTGYTSDELTGTSPFELVHADDLHVVRAHYDEHIVVSELSTCSVGGFHIPCVVAGARGC